MLKPYFAASVIATLLASSGGLLTAQSCTAFVGVSVISMANDQISADETVIVRGGRIAAIGPSRDVTIRHACTTVDGRSRYLMPGLVDSHVHLPLSGREDQLLVLNMLLANGITMAINMEGSPQIVGLRDEIRAGKLMAPTLYTTGKFIQQPEFQTADQVEKEVLAEKAAGYDFIKVHGELTKEAYDAVFKTASKVHMRVVGHVPGNLGIDAALGRQSLIVHSEEFLYSYFQFHRDLPVEPAEIDQMVRVISERTASSGTWVSPTLSVFHQIISQAADIDALLQRPEMQYMPRHLTTGAAVGATNFGWYPPDNPYVKRWPPEKIPYLLAQYRIMQKLTLALHQAGVPLLVGTDPFVPCVIPGFSIRDELEQMHAAGLTNYVVLQAATINAARFLGVQNEVGTVSLGKRADLLLLNANPLDDIDNTFQQEGVMLRGQWFVKDALQRQLKAAQ
jgi:imidazolonepropionase-like amidohydrolase